MKKNIWKRLLSLAMALVLVAGMLPMTALKAYAAPSEAETIPTSNTGKHAYSENLTVYYKHNNYLYKVVFSNIKDLDTVGLCFASSTSSTLLLAGNRGMYLAPTPEVTTRVDISNFPTQTGSSVNFYLRYNAVNAVNQRNPVVTVTCMGAGDPTWSWNGTSAATAVFTSTDGNATITVGANITSSTQRATSCLEKDQTIYTATATCNGQAYTTTKTVDGAAGPHSYTYTADGSVLTETCTNSCGHQAIASIVAGEALYTGSEITNAATISYDPGTWAGDEPVLNFENNVNVGTATVKMTAGDATASTTFKINPASLSDATVTLDPASGTYTGSYHGMPNYTLTYNGKELVKNTDYIVDADWSGNFTNVGSCNLTLKGNGNFTGYNTLTYTIHKATPDKDDFSIELPQNAIYDDETAYFATVSVKDSVNGMGDVTVKYNGSTTPPTDAGTYTVTVDVAAGDNYNAATIELGSFTIAKAEGNASVSVADWTYGDAPNAPVVSSTNGTDNVTYQYKVKGADDSTYTDTVPTQAGDYTVKASFAATQNYTVATATDDFTISRRPITVTAEDASATYGDGAPLTWTVTSGNKVGSDWLDINIIRESGEDVGTYTITVGQDEGANPNYDITFVNGTFTIHKASLTVIVHDQEIVYGDEIGEIIAGFDGFLDTTHFATQLDLSNEVRTSTYKQYDNVGTYPITISGITSRNYAITYVPGTLTVNPKPITVTIADKTSVYGEAMAELTANTDGIVNNDTNVYSLATDASSTANVGTYPITGTALDANYTITFVNGTYTITKAPAVATAPTAVSGLIYNTAPQTLIATGSTNDGNIVYSLEKEGTYTAEPPKAIDAGTYTVWYKVVGDSNHNDIEPDFVSVEIKKANASVDAPAAISGLVYNGREQTLVIPVESMDGTVYYSLDGVTYTDYVPKGINAQEYTVYYKVVGDANHNDMEPKTVTATIAPWNIETAPCKAGVRGGPFTYNGQEHTPTPQIEVWVDGYPVPESPYEPGADVRLTEGTDYTVTYSNNVNAGQAVVTFTGKGNYTGTITRKFTIAPKPITVTIADKTSVYGEAVAELTAATDGIVNNDTNVYSLATTATSTANAGTYSITGTTLDNNYAITFVNGTYTITKAPVNSTGTDVTVSYTAGMEVDLRQMFTIDENAGEADYWITHLTGDDSFTSAPYLYRIDKAGTFTVKITTKETENYKSGEATAVLTVNPGDPGIGAVTAGVVNDTLETSAIVLTRENTDVNGNLTVDAGQTLAWGDNTIRYTFTPNDTTNYKVVKGEVTVSVVDTIAPVGTVSIDDNKWNDLWNTITFGLFFKETKTVKVAAEDVLSGIAKVEYYDSAVALTADALKAITAWNDMGADYAQDVTAEDAKTFIYYIRITDKAGNVTYISTADATYDLTKPAISGITNGSTYYTTQKVTVTDKNIDTITLNGEAATDAITLEGNKEATYTIVATDKAGNSTTVTVTMKPIKELAKATENLGNDNVTSADAPALEELVAKLDELIADPDTSDDGERETLEQHKVIAEALLKTIEDVAKATDTENTAKVEDVTADNVTPEDKSNLEDAKADLEDALENNGGNYTEEEKQVIQDEIQRIEDALEIVENVEAAEDAISDLPATVEPDDEETVAKIEEAKKIYGGLTDYEKSLVDEKVKEKLDKLTVAAVAYDIVKGDGGKWSEGTASGLSFTANGPISKFVSVEIDGKVIDAKYYSVKAGSTIITLNASYLETLSVGTHTITVVYSDGETEGTFKINPKSATPATGDNFNVLLWTSVMIVSLAAIAVLLIEQKKRRYVK